MSTDKIPNAGRGGGGSPPVDVSRQAVNALGGLRRYELAVFILNSFTAPPQKFINEAH